MHYIILLALLTGCAFKGQNSATTTAHNAAKQQFARTITVSWSREGNLVSVKRAMLGSGNFSLNEPITIPAVVPDSIKIIFDSSLVGSNKVLQEPRIFISEGIDDKTAGTPMRLKGIINSNILEITGLKTFFAMDKEQRGIIQVALLNAITGDAEVQLNLVLVTPPVNIVAELLAKHTMQDQELKKLIAPEMRLDLLWILKIKNPNAQRLEFVLPNQLSGSIQKYFKKYNIVQHHCASDIWQNEWTEKYPTRFFILPIENSIKNEWTAKISDKEHSIYLNNGEEILLGIYGSGSMLASFVDNGIPSSSHTTVNAVDYCERTECDLLLLKSNTARCSPKTITYYKESLLGVDTSGANIVIDESSSKIQVRNGFLSHFDDPEFRIFQILKLEFPVM